MDYCVRNPDACKEGSVLYKIHNEPIANVLTISNVITIGIAWVLTKYFMMSFISFVVLAILLIAASIWIHKKAGMQTAEGKFMGIMPNTVSAYLPSM